MKHVTCRDVLIVGVLLPLVSLAADFKAALPSSAKAFIDKNCLGCHRSASAPAGIDLTQLSFNLDDVNTFGIWVRVHDAVKDGRMPKGMPVSTADRAAFVTAIARPMVAHEDLREADQGRAVLRRLNRYEYENTMRDLLSARWLQLRESFPEDGLIQRFNKSGEGLDVSHVQMSQYFDTAEKAIRLALAAVDSPEHTNRYYARQQRSFIGRMRITRPTGSGIQQLSHERATVPLLGFDAQPDVLTGKSPMTVGAADPKTRELEAFATTTSTYIGGLYQFDGFSAPVGGHYRLRFNAYSTWIATSLRTEKTVSAAPDTKAWRPDLYNFKASRGRTTEPLTIYALGPGDETRLLGSFDVGPDPSVHELEVDLLPGERIRPDAARLWRPGVGFVESYDASEQGTPGLAYRWMEVTGPVEDPASRERFRKVFGGLDNGSGAPDAERLLRMFMANAYRRPPTEQEVQHYLKIVTDRLGGGFKEAMIAGYAAILCSPGFLYLEEQPGPLNSYALASRLSYFLWNAPPDDELRRLSAEGKLRRPEVLRAQTNRLLDSPRSADFIDAFLDYWLDLRKLTENAPDQTLYNDYYLDDLLADSSLQETQLYFAYLLHKDLPVRNIVNSNFSILNSRLATHYGLPPIDGVAMRYVELPANSVRGGLLTQASVLKVTANGTTTSPVTRGAWIMERILGKPSPPPPPGVGAIDPDTRGATTIRQQLDKHRALQSCAVCHTRIDPPGFALENFDVFGGWRDRYRSTQQGDPVNGYGKDGLPYKFRIAQPVDASGQLATGEKFQDIVSFKHLLLNDERQIARNMVQQFVVYATGAPVSFSDRAEVERILNAAQADHYGIRTLLHQVVQSKLFTSK